MNATEGFKLEVGDGSQCLDAVFRVVTEGGQALLELDGRQKVTNGGNMKSLKHFVIQEVAS